MSKRSKKYTDDVDRKVDYSAIKPCPQCGCSECDMFEWTPKPGHFRSSIICPVCDFELDSPTVDHNQQRRKDADWLFHLETDLIEKWNKTKKSRKPKTPTPVEKTETTPEIEPPEPEKATPVPFGGSHELRQQLLIW